MLCSWSEKATTFPSDCIRAVQLSLEMELRGYSMNHTFKITKLLQSFLFTFRLETGKHCQNTTASMLRCDSSLVCMTFPPLLCLMEVPVITFKHAFASNTHKNTQVKLLHCTHQCLNERIVLQLLSGPTPGLAHPPKSEEITPFGVWNCTGLLEFVG